MSLPTSLQVRMASPRDATTIALLGRVSFGETFGYLFETHPSELRPYLDATFALGKIERSLAKAENRYWLAELDALPIGYAKLKHPSPPPRQPDRPAAQLQKIYLLREFLGDGIGAVLLQQLVQHAAGLSPILWLDVLRQNRRATAFYERHGFRLMGEDTYRIGSQDFRFHLMARPLP